MIIHHIIMGLLLYSPSIFALPTTNTKTKNITTTTAADINDSFSDIAVDTLITKVSELSERYRKDENSTIADIQQMLQVDSTLPRLTRGEIIDLLENLTRTKPEIWKDRIEKSRKDFQRAIMLVMPYTPKNADNLSIEELFTKPPITHIVGTESTRTTTRKPFGNKHFEILAPEPSTAKPIANVRFNKPINKPIKVETNQEKVQIPEQKPKKEIVVKQVSNKSNISTRRPTTTKSTITKSTTIKPTTYKPTTYKPTTYRPTRFSNHKYTENNFVPSNQGMKIINPPILAPRPDEINNAFWHDEKQNRPIQSSNYKASLTSTIRPRIRSTTSTQNPLSNLDVPEEMKDAVKDINFGEMEAMKPPKFSSQYDASVINFPKEISTENVRDLLDSIGVLPTQYSTKLPDIKEIADTLSPDMRELLMSFGLIENPEKPVNLNPPPPPTPYSEDFNINPYSYTQFKPLPDSAPTRHDMAEFLAGFGLTGNSQRDAKKIEPQEPPKLPTNLTKVPRINMDMIPSSLHEIMEDIGLSETKEKQINFDQEAKESHVFNPEQTNVNETEVKRLNQLLETIKRLEKLNRTATPEDLKDLDLENIRELTKILKQDASMPLDQQNFGPDPLDFDISPEKNEVKRQQSTTTQKPAESSTEAKYPSLDALAESFGGNTAAGAENVDESLPPPRRTGFYYLVDWNSFLEVGEEGKNKVNIRFSPRAGDSSRFLRVNVP